MDFECTDVQRSWRAKAQALGRDLPEDPAAADVITGAARVGLIDPGADLVAVSLAVEALASESAAAGMTLALHTTTLLACAHPQGTAGRSAQGERWMTALARGEMVGALALSSEDVPSFENGRLGGRASWVGPITDGGIAVVGARQGSQVTACAVALDGHGVQVTEARTSALSGFVWAYVLFAGTPCLAGAEPTSIMARARTLIASVALGIGTRALRESLAVVHREHGAGGEQTVQGLLADTATELEAARMLTWQAAAKGPNLSLADGSMAKLAATGAAQAAVVRATQVVGVDSFRRGHVIERLTQDVRAIELFAGRTEALRESVADAELPQVSRQSAVGSGQ
ncbi:MAG TPA: acyl-CoA dehydrogenase family protein [Vicinamibacterales bacterium]|jgi:alkylation response protein AidB-like acyl-CoA dehydrogenase